MNERNKKYYKNNKEKINEKCKDYYENNKEIRKQYYENNKDKVLKKCKEYRENNKDKIAEKITCECGCEIRHDYLLKHLKTKKHQKLINN